MSGNLQNAVMLHVTCLRLAAGNFLPAKHIESLIKGASSAYSQAIGVLPSKNFTHAQFASIIPDALIFRMFYPAVDYLLFEQLIAQHAEQKNTVDMLTQQLKAQEEWAAFVKDVFESISVTQTFLRQLDQMTLNPTQRASFEACRARFSLVTPALFHLSMSGHESIAGKLEALFRKKHKIIVDNTTQDGDSFFQAIRAQFGDMVTGDALSTEKQRGFVQAYSEQNQDHFIDEGVRVWRAVPGARNASLLAPYMVQDDAQAARKLLKDQVMLRREFWAEHFVIAVIVYYVEQLTGRKIMLIVVDAANSPFGFLGMSNKSEVNCYTFLYSDREHYSGVSVDGHRHFTRRTLPELEVHLV